MNCPACARQLQGKTTGPIKVDVCDGGCGGIWFDRFELQKVDESHEAACEPLLQVAVDSIVQIDPKKRTTCPRCTGQIMMRHFFSAKRKVEVDECPKCTGFWLDVGELRVIREEYPDEDARRKAAEAYFDEVFASKMIVMRQKGKEGLERSRSIARIFRFLCPSYYLPGDQEWGAF